MENVNTQRRRPAPRKRKVRLAIKLLLRSLLVFFTVIALAVVGLYMICDLIFNGPSESARDVLTMSMLESSGMKWFPAIFIGQEKVDEIQSNISVTLPNDVSVSDKVVINPGNQLTNKEWEGHPDGIRIENVYGDTYNAYVMLIRDPSAVYMATSSDTFSTSIPGERIHNQIIKEGALAAINAGAFYDNGTTSSVVGSVPEGLVVAGGKVVWNSGAAPKEGFVGFNKDNIMVVAKTMTADQAMELNIRDGCCFGPVLIMDGVVNQEAYNEPSGWNPRTAIGQRADGTVIFLCIDGRQAGSLGGSYADIIDIMVEFGAVNACNLDGGSSTVMLYKDTQGLYGDDVKLWDNDIAMINNYSLLQKEPRRMPTFFMVRPGSED
ncbi:MAG: phosphodiester glycosidase family protein [Oscillospiraceae bacterium]|nr:phosphodiester glycosidase family protein [Oscillospiraceae bacterium]